MRIIKEDDLLAEICFEMGWDEFGEGRFEAEVERVLVNADGVEIVRTKQTTSTG